jgi:alkylation response protein AidB-like acyl-CoA dehydrogenase
MQVEDKSMLDRAAAAADTSAAIDAGTLELVHRRGWLRLLAPGDAGGGEVPLPQVVRFLESLAEVDGSVAWFVTLCSGAGWFVGYLRRELAREVMRTPGVCLAGSGAVGGEAFRDGDGWRIRGTWAHATGAPHATHLTMNAMANGRVRSFIVPAGDVQVQDTWRSIGLRATASHAFRIEDAWVQSDHAFDIDPVKATADGPLYRFPFASLAYVTLAANIGGMARHFIELAAKDIDTGTHDATRERFFALLDDAWAKVVRNEAVDEEELRMASLAWAHTSRETVDRLYPHCGLAAADPRTTINRVWRDLHTATQHALLRPALTDS